MKTNFTQLETTITKQIFMRVLGFGLCFGLIVFLILVPIQRKGIKQEAIKEAKHLANAIVWIYLAVDTQEELKQASQILLEVARSKTIQYINVLDFNHRVFYSTNPNQIGRHQNTELPIYENGNSLQITQKAMNERTSLVESVSVVLNLDSVYREYNIFYIQLGVFLALAIFLLSLLMAFMTKQMVGTRLWRLASTMENAERGMFLVRARVDKMDEIGLVSFGFNRLLAAITHLQARNIEKDYDLQDAQEQLSIKAQLELFAEELKQSNKKLHKRVVAQELLMEAAHHLGEISNSEEVVSRLSDLIVNKLKLQDFAIFLSKTLDDLEELKLAKAHGMANIDLIKNLTFAIGEGITGLAAQTKMPISVLDISKDKRLKVWQQTAQKALHVPDFLKNGSLASIPMVYQKKVLGVMDFFYSKKNAFQEEDIELLHALGALAAIAMANAKLYEETLQLATQDSLTKTLNRRSMERLIDHEIARSQRFHTPISLCMIDVDYFKLFNDRMGHLMGDEVLKEVAKLIQNTIRKVDSLARFGGEEFCLILPQTPLNSAKEVAEKILKQVNELKLPGILEQPLGCLSVSIGISEYPENVAMDKDKSDKMNLIHAADVALYAAKKAGRNRIVTFHPSA